MNLKTVFKNQTKIGVTTTTDDTKKTGRKKGYFLLLLLSYSLVELRMLQPGYKSSP